MSNVLKTYRNFFLAGLLKQGQTGAIVPSQRFLIAKMIAPIPENYHGQIIELGAGSGALTLRLAAKCPDAQILSCEINQKLAQVCKDNIAIAGHDDRVVVVSKSAEQLLSEKSGHTEAKPDFIISGIPLGNLGTEKTQTFLEIICQMLVEGGMYIQFQHSLLDWKKVRAQFPKSRAVPAFFNFPPAVVYYAKK